jgi:signal transduction histidine kinase
MTRRLMVAILVTVWTTLLIAGTASYFTARARLLAQLDRALFDRAVALPEITDASGKRFITESHGTHADDRYIVRNELGQTVARPAGQNDGATGPDPLLMSRAFTKSDDGARSRSITIRAFGRPADEFDRNLPAVPVTITFRGSAADFDSTMSLLRWTLIGCGLAGGLVAALLSKLIAARCLAPLQRTADVVGSIDERALNRRIDLHGMPKELKPMATRLNEMLARLEDSFARRRRFLANASHELRTPVAAMLTTLEVALRRPRDADAYRRALETAVADARLMRTLVESLMSQARAEIPALDEEPQEIDLAVMIDQIVTSMQAIASEARVLLRSEASPITIKTQPARLRSVLINLIGNAIHHNRPGGAVDVTASESQAQACLVIADTGPGIAPEHLSQVFEPFNRADKSRTADGHLGLGLFLVKTHVEALGGTVRIISEVGTGTRFEISLGRVLHRRGGHLSESAEVSRSFHKERSVVQ